MNMYTLSYDELVAQNEHLSRQLHEMMQKNKKLLLCVETLGKELEERDEMMMSLQLECDEMRAARDKMNKELEQLHLEKAQAINSNGHNNSWSIINTLCEELVILDDEIASGEALVESPEPDPYQSVAGWVRRRPRVTDDSASVDIPTPHASVRFPIEVLEEGEDEETRS